jgi:hypothetical protein
MSLIRHRGVHCIRFVAGLISCSPDEIIHFQSLRQLPLSQVPKDGTNSECWDAKSACKIGVPLSGNRAASLIER